MNPWKPYPLCRLVLPFLAGIASSAWHLISCPAAYFFGILGVTILVLIVYRAVKYRYSFRWIPGMVIVFAVYCSGVLTETQKRHCENFIPLPEKSIVTMLVRISEAPQIKPGSIKAVAVVNFAFHSGKWYTSGEKTLIRFPADHVSNPVMYGRYFMIRGIPEKIEFLYNPHTFNYARYLVQNGVKYQVYCRKGHFRQIISNSSGSITVWASDIRDYLLKIFSYHGIRGQEFSVVAALLLGYVNDIDSDLKNSFAVSGTMHILSVSGMHVGIIFLFLEVVLGFLKKIRNGLIIQSLIEVLLIWFYAVITGLSPAVLRAATTLSFIIAGKALKRKPEMLNLLCASVFLLLIMNPGLISDIGFQLSYLAVLGILVLYKSLYDLFVTRYWLPDKIWALVSVSLAAQIATFPLSIYYFHRFPNYFILSNLVIVPFSNSIIILGVISLIFAQLPYAGNILMFCLNVLLRILNKSVLMIGHLPGAVTDGFFPGIFDVLLIYLIIVGTLLFLLQKKSVFLFLTLVSFLIFESSVLISTIRQSGRFAVAVHKSQNGYLIRVQKGDHELCLYSDVRVFRDSFLSAQLSSEREVEKIRMVYSRPVRVQGKQDRLGFYETAGSGQWIIIGKFKIFLFDGRLKIYPVHRIHADLVLLTGNRNFSMEELAKTFTPDAILNVSAAGHQMVLERKSRADALGLRFYDLKTAGFYQMEL